MAGQLFNWIPFCLMASIYIFPCMFNASSDEMEIDRRRIRLNENDDSTNEQNSIETTYYGMKCQVECQMNHCRNSCQPIRRRKSYTKLLMRMRRYASSSDASRDLQMTPATSDASAFDDDVFSGSDHENSFSRDVRNDVKCSKSTASTPEHSITAGVTISPKRLSNAKSLWKLAADIYFMWKSPPGVNWTNRTITLHWMYCDCQVDKRFPVCSLPNLHRHKVILNNANQWTNYTLTGQDLMLFNAKYDLKMEYEHKIVYEIGLTTPGCYEPTDDHVRCFTKPGLIPMTTPDPSLVISLKCIEYDVRGRGGVAIHISWPLEECSCSSSSSSNQTMPLTRCNSTVFRRSHRTNHIFTKSIDCQEVRLDRLATNDLYEITVQATNGVWEVQFESLIVNTSIERLKSEDGYQKCPLPAPQLVGVNGTMTEKPLSEGSNGILIGALVFASLSICALVIVIHRKCAAGLSSAKRPTILPRKDNSYKTSPSEGLLLKDPDEDEWEINPKDVILGVEIGQGAFGRVLTGSYRNKEVAIKVLRDCIPDFYREDLLREISLMKGIGFHPNIVTMLGACTTREPIALIVEYMPFGNLQLFLKKCRFDREMHVAEDRDKLTYCLLDEVTGIKESWNMAATDIISFARQVVLAMEYLVEHHYVHRDLAARNVLLGSNKVVKVCDFGLARLVYMGDQYFKLTSGRLPLKWMAIESIRDRVFTTYSDVWSFGILLWEMVTLGASPYPGVALIDLYRLLSEGYRMQQPVNCSDELYDIISQCWCENPTDRPKFSRLRTQMEELLTRDLNYLDLDGIDIPIEIEHSESEDVLHANATDLFSREDICIC